MLPLKQYSGSTMGNLPIGQGIARHADADGRRATPRSPTAASCAPPHIVASVGGKKTDEAQGPARDLRGDRGLGAQDARGRPRPGRHRLRRARSRATTLAGKTGTAEKAINGEYSKDKYVASFVGFAPAKQPKLLVAVMVDEPKGEIYGGQVAAPAWRRSSTSRSAT